MIIKNIEELRTDIIATHASRLPNLDLTEGTPERDLFVEAPIAGQLSGLWDGLAYAQKLHAPLKYYEELTDAEINDYCATYNVIPLAATYSSGTATFYTTSEPTEDIIITGGTVVATLGSSTTAVEFEVVGSFTLYFANKNTYYNAVTERWEIDATIRALLAGPDYRAGKNSITNLVSSVTGIQGVTNALSVTGGVEAETIEERLRRVNEKFQGRDLGSTLGLKSHLSVYSRYINIVGSNDPLMLRDEGLGGAIDIYVLDSSLTTVTDTTNITSTGLINSTNVDYTTTSITMDYQPVKQVSGVVKNDVTLSVSYYTFVADTGLLKKSTSGYDKIVLTSAGIAAVGLFADGDTVAVTYNYNSLLHTIKDDVNSTANHYQNRDYLAREMTEVTIATYIKFKEVAGQDFNTIATAVELVISTFINAIKTAGDVELADIIGATKSHTGVDNIDITTPTITPTGGGTLTAQGDVLIGKNEYPTSGVITLERWTN